MFEGRHRRARAVSGALVIVGLLAIGSRAAAQDRVRDETRLDSVRTVLDSLGQAIRRLRPATETSRPHHLMASLQVGPLMIEANPVFRTLGEAAAHEATDSIVALVGTSIRRLATFHFVVDSVTDGWNSAVSWWGDGQESNRDSTPVPGVTTSVIDSNGVQGWGSHQDANAHLVAAAWTAAAANILEGQLTPPALRAWSRTAVPLNRASEDDWGYIRFDLATAGASIVRRCINGDIDACAKALDLTPTANPLPEWYDSTDRAHVVPRLVLGDTEPILVPRARQSVLRVAMAMGGPEALQRLTAANGTAKQDIEAIAGAPLDSILRTWHRQVVEVPSGPTWLNAMTICSSLFWALTLAALALRSSRWR